MKFNLLQGRLEKHRLHPDLVHFPTALYPFSLVMDLIGSVAGNADYFIVGRLSLFAAVGMSMPAISYGLLDFLKIDSTSIVWKKAGLHGLLNFIWFLIFCSLSFCRVNRDPVGNLYLIIMSLSTIGLFYSNYLGADLIISHRIGIEPHADKKSERL